MNGSEAYIYGNPGEGLADDGHHDRPRRRRSRCRSRSANYTAVEFTANRRFSNNWFLGGSYVFSRLYGNYPGS